MTRIPPMLCAGLLLASACGVDSPPAAAAVAADGVAWVVDGRLTPPGLGGT
jgi:hypothetical protein